MIGAMPSGATPPVARASIMSKPCALGKNGVLYAANRGNENNFGMHVNKVKLGGPGEEELLADFCEYGEGDGKCTWPFGVAVDNQRDHVYVSDDWRNTISVFDSSGKFLTEVGQDRQRRRPVAAPGRLGRREERQHHRRRQRQQPAAGLHPGRQVCRQVRRPRQGRRQFNQPWGITLDKDGNIYVADWKNHRIQKLSPEGKFLMKFGQYGKVEEPEGSYAVTMFGPYVAATVGDGRLSEARDSSTIRPMLPWTPMAISTSPIGATIGFASSIPREGRSPHLIGDAQVVSKWGQQTVDANPDMAKARRRVKSLEPSSASASRRRWNSTRQPTA